MTIWRRAQKTLGRRCGESMRTMMFDRASFISWSSCGGGGGLSSCWWWMLLEEL